MPTINNRDTLKTAYLSILVVFGLGSLSYAQDEDDQTTPQPTDSNSVAFTLMDVEAMIAYRDERRDTLAESLAESNLSAEQQQLVANAVAKAYVGIPVSSYTQSTKILSSEDEDSTENSSRVQVNVAGHTQREGASHTNRLDSNNPFFYFPAVPFVAESGQLLDESDSSATFEFDFDFPMDNAEEDEMMANLVKKMKWVFEISVSKADQTPERITMKLTKPVRKRFVFKMSTFQVDIHYSFIESCDCFAVTMMRTRIEASAIVAGRIEETVELTYSEIDCEPPKRFLLPEEPESSFLAF